jgi:hypothetical protein
MKIAQIAPLYEALPPRLYGGTERIVAHLTDARRAPDRRSRRAWVRRYAVRGEGRWGEERHYRERATVGGEGCRTVTVKKRMPGWQRGHPPEEFLLTGYLQCESKDSPARDHFS